MRFFKDDKDWIVWACTQRRMEEILLIEWGWFFTQTVLTGNLGKKNKFEGPDCVSEKLQQQTNRNHKSFSAKMDKKKKLREVE